MKRILMPAFNRKRIDQAKFSLEIVEVNRVQDLPKYLFG